MRTVVDTAITEPARRTPVLAQADVVVVGSGPGGLAAAIGAARAGVSVILLERNGCFGGNITQVGVEGFAWYRHESTVDSEGGNSIASTSEPSKPNWCDRTCASTDGSATTALDIPVGWKV